MNSRTTRKQKIILIFTGFFLLFAVLEISLQILSVAALHFYTRSALPETDKNRVLCIGDSFTYGLGADSIDGNYPARLQELFGNDAVVENIGVPGNNTADVLSRLEEYSKPFKIAVVLAGVNNLWNSRGINLSDYSWMNNFKTFRLFSLLWFRISYFFNSENNVTDSKNIQNNDSAQKKEEYPVTQVSGQSKYRDFFREYLEAKSESALRKFYLLHAAIADGRDGLVQQQTKELISFYQEDIRFRYLYTLLKIRNASYIEAKKYADEYTEKFPDTVYSYILQGHAVLKSGAVEQAIELFEQAWKHTDTNNYENIIRQFHTAKILCRLYVMAGHPHRAVELIEKNISERSFFYLYLLSETYMRMGRYEAAAGLMTSSDIVQEYRNFENVKKYLNQFSEKKYKECAVNFFDLLFYNTEDSFALDYARKKYSPSSEDYTFTIISWFFYKYPSSSRIWATLGYVFSETRDMFIAEKAFSLALSITGKSSEVYVLYSYFLQDTGRLPESLSAMEKAYNMDRNPEILFEKLKLLVLISPSSALIQIRSYEAEYGGSDRLYLLQARCLEAKGSLGECAEVLKKIDSSDDDTIIKAAMIWKKIDIRQAGQLLKPLISKNNERAISVQADMYSDQGKYTQALDLLRKMPDSEKKNASTGTVYLKKGNYFKAEGYFRECFQKNPDNAEYVYNYLKCLTENKKFPDALKIIDRIQNGIFSTNALIQSQRAFILLGTGETDAAMAQIDKIIRDFKGNKQAMTEVLSCLLVAGKKERFSEQCESWKIELSENSDFHFLQGKFYFDNSETEKAYKELKKSVELNSQNIPALNLLGTLRARTNPEEASEYMRQAFLLSGDFRTYCFNIRYCSDDVTELSGYIEKAMKILKEQGLSGEYDEAEQIAEIIRNETILEKILYSHYDEMLKICRLRGAKLILLTYPQNTPVNDIIRKYAHNRGIVLVDNELIFRKNADSSYFVPDGHCNNKGYWLMAKNVYEVLKNDRETAYPESP